MAKASPKDNGLPNQLLNKNIKPIKLINTICPACMLAYNRIKSEKGLIKIPKTSIGINMMYNGSLPYQGMESPRGSNICFQ